jgi:hypothetical protein
MLLDQQVGSNDDEQVAKYLTSATVTEPGVLHLTATIDIVSNNSI